MDELTGIIVLLVVVGIFAWIGIRYARSSSSSLEQYTTSRNTLSAVMGSSTIFATGMGAWILFSPAEAAITAGLFALVLYAVASACSLWIFLIVGKKLRTMMPNGHALTEFILHRYGRGMYAAVLLATLMYMFLALTAELTGISLAARLVFGLPLHLTALIVAVGTAAYTSIGGFRTSVFTDFIQALFIIPLLLLVFIGGWAAAATPIISTVQSLSPSAFSLTRTGLEYGITLIIAVIGAELFNQSWWQRVYAAKDNRTMSRSFLYSGIAVIPAILLAGSFGFFAIASGTSENPSSAFFAFISTAAPSFLIISAMVLVILLIMSTIDTLLNGMASLLTVEFVRIKPSTERKSLVSVAKILTIILSLAAATIASQGLSVLYLFLLADIFCVAFVLPVFYGMYSKKLTPSFAILAGTAGLVSGLLLFPDPSFTRGNLLWSFVLAFFTPLFIILLSRSGEFNFTMLRKKVKEFD